MNVIESEVYKVSNMSGAAQFLIDALGFHQQQMVNGLLLNNGSVTIRLKEEKRADYANKGLHFELKAKSSRAARTHRFSRLDVRLLSSTEQNGLVRCENRVQGPFGITITVM
ncbi:MAG: hypothetical protein GQ581_08200 [Methyloprofundus sp.]|nr:hypothetical protein [Methyloprofundus sp.]